LLLFFFLPIFAFFSFLNETVHADKINVLEKISKFNSLSFLHQKSLPSSLAKLILDYKNGKNILT